MNKYALAIFLLFSCTCVLRSQPRCFDPLADPKSTKSVNWKKDFIDFIPTETPQGVKHLHRIADGVEDKINLDFYYFTFQQPTDPDKTIDKVFKDVRQHFSRIVSGIPSTRGPTGLKFEPYGASKDTNDPLYVQNKKLWESDNPKGALMSFTFDTIAPAYYVGLKKWTFAIEQGDVVVECFTKTDFMFTTAYTIEHTEHPVSGNRGFGIMDNRNGTWAIYAKASDRETRQDNGQPYIANRMLKNHLGLIRGFPGGEDAVFQQGHEFWLKFFPNLFEYLEEQGIKVNRNSFVTNSCRYRYSPASGPSPDPFLCPPSEPNPRPGPTPGPVPPDPTPGSPNPTPGPTPRPTP